MTIHRPKSSETTGMFGRERLSRMKPYAYLVNTARAGIVDERAVYNVLAEGSIAGAALDVFEREPAQANTPLLGLKNLIVSPHVAGVTSEALERMSVATVRNLHDVLNGKAQRENVVNPEVLDSVKSSPAARAAAPTC